MPISLFFNWFLPIESLFLFLWVLSREGEIQHGKPKTQIVIKKGIKLSKMFHLILKLSLLEVLSIRMKTSSRFLRILYIIYSVMLGIPGRSTRPWEPCWRWRGRRSACSASGSSRSCSQQISGLDQATFCNWHLAEPPISQLRA